MNIVEGPCALTQMAAKGVPEIVVTHDVPQRMHPALQATVHQVAETRNVIRANFATGRISFLPLGAMEEHVEVDKVEVTKGTVSPFRAESIKSTVESLKLRLEHHKASRREILRNNDLRVRPFGVETLRYNNLRKIDQLPRKAFQRLGVVIDVVRGELDLGTVDELRLRAPEFDGRY